MRICALAICVGCLVAISSVFAHGPQLQINNVGGKIVTREILTDTYMPLTDSKSVYVMPVLEHQGVWYTRPETELYPSGHLLEGQPKYYSGAGLAYGIGQTFVSGSSFQLKFDDGLKSWNGVGYVDAGDTQLQAYRGGSIGLAGELIDPSASAVSTDAAPFAELAFAPIAESYDDQAHSTARFRFLGDGTMPALGTGTTATEPLDGIYLARFVISTTEANVDLSDPFYFVMHKNAEWGNVLTAVRSLGVPASQVQYLGVPEPASLALAGIVVIVISAITRRCNKV